MVVFRRDYSRVLFFSLAMFFVTYCHFINILPAVSQTSLNGIADCAASPSCASQLGLKTMLKNPPPKDLLVTAGAGFLTTVGAGGLIMHIGQGGFNHLQEKAKERLSGWPGVTINGTTYKWVINTQCGINDRPSYAVGDAQPQSTGTGYCPSTATQLTNRYQYTTWISFNPSTGGSSQGTDLRSNDSFRAAKADWNDATTAQRSDGIDALQRSDFDTMPNVTNQTITYPSSGDTFPYTASVPTIIQAGSNAPYTLQPGETANIPIPGRGGSPSPSPSSSPSSSPSPSPSTSPSSSPSPSPSSTPTSYPNSDPLLIPANTEVPVKGFTAQPWPQHASSVLGAKFPFDVFGSINFSGSNDCPSYTFFNETIELCFVRDFISVLKWPTILGFAVWAIVAL